MFAFVNVITFIDILWKVLWKVCTILTFFKYSLSSNVLYSIFYIIRRSTEDLFYILYQHYTLFMHTCYCSETTFGLLKVRNTLWSRFTEGRLCNLFVHNFCTAVILSSSSKCQGAAEDQWIVFFCDVIIYFISTTVNSTHPSSCRMWTFLVDDVSATWRFFVSTRSSGLF